MYEQQRQQQPQPAQPDVYAVPGRSSIIDTINPSTGRTAICGHTEAEVRAREPRAVRMTYADWQAAAVARQQGPIVWEATTREQYHEMLEILPPAVWIGGAFMVGEPMDHCFATGRPRFSAYWQRSGGEYVTASRPLTVAEFKKEIGR